MEVAPIQLPAVLHELEFWRKFVQTPRFLEGWCSNQPNPELRDGVRDFLQQEVPDAHVLDVGSGVVSLLYGTVDTGKLTTADLLGGFYKLIFDYAAAGIAPPLPIGAEQLPYEGVYDVVHASNALDHCQHPYLALARMVAATRKGGWTIVQGHVREGTHEQWKGLHQWDMWLDRNGTLYIQGNGLPQPRIGRRADRWWVQRLETGRDWYVWMAQR